MEGRVAQQYLPAGSLVSDSPFSDSPLFGGIADRETSRIRSVKSAQFRQNGANLRTVDRRESFGAQD
ncbi:hypothetical protein Sinac_0679 [Singulisphaera acidiphila DSM 18658]|uniref:Uncharacterized protein n=1 Tax=Singulisphaera acidiphila (strain ATCC BAA-1392 / DSM 18658 / VKM B-2454 / MOB10) TaxID=886293 RepID=L0D8X6_SINAD|nr:hypothetical protein Sinac_0679 [Singulisphaera acidiphila DSM 18658]